MSKQPTVQDLLTQHKANIAKEGIQAAKDLQGLDNFVKLLKYLHVLSGMGEVTNGDISKAHKQDLFLTFITSLGLDPEVRANIEFHYMGVKTNATRKGK